MALNRDVETGIDGVLAPEWSIRNGTVVPDPDPVFFLFSNRSVASCPWRLSALLTLVLLLVLDVL
jgi:hypothetical protein